MILSRQMEGTCSTQETAKVLFLHQPTSNKTEKYLEQSIQADGEWMAVDQRRWQGFSTRIKL